MGFTFGTKKSEVKESDGVYLRNFKKGETKVRFLQEPGDWFAYREHFDPGLNRTFPCLQDNKAVCPGCTSDNERTQANPRRYGTFVYLIERETVLPFKVPQRLSERLQIRAERNEGTLLSRDYIIIKSGAGLDTEYDVDQDERYPLDIETLWKQRGDKEIDEIVAHQFTEVFGDPEMFIKNSDQAERPKAEVVKSTDEPPWETKSENVEVTEDQLKKMSRTELHAVWTKAGLAESEWNDDWSKSEAVYEILRRAE